MVSVLIVGWLGGVVSSILRIPRIVSMILLGIALYPSLHPSVMQTGVSPFTVAQPTLNTTRCPLSTVGNDTFTLATPACTAATVTSAYDFSAAGGAQNPASSIRTLALLIALVRGGLSVKASFFREMGVATVLLATVPYAFELVAMARLAPAIVPQY